jgi:hypothetical protein
MGWETMGVGTTLIVSPEVAKRQFADERSSRVFSTTSGSIRRSRTAQCHNQASDRRAPSALATHARALCSDFFLEGTFDPGTWTCIGRQLRHGGTSYLAHEVSLRAKEGGQAK